MIVDTVKLLKKMPDPLILNNGLFQPSLDELVKGSYRKAVLNPSPMYAKLGKYMPRLTVNKRPSSSGPKYELAIEFSAPKIVFDNNFDELDETDFELLLTKLQEKLYELVGYRFFRAELASAEVGSWHPSKNIVFLDYTSTQTILNTISKLDVSRVYDLERVVFRDGHVVHVHCNSLDIAFYDKVADLRKTKLSPKRSIDRSNTVQLGLFEKTDEQKPFEVFRYEVRLVGKASIKRAFPELENWTFEALFKKELSKQLLLKHWNKLTASVDMLALDPPHKPYELLQNYLIENPNVTPQTAMAAVTGLLINGQEGVVHLRNLLESRFGVHSWYRIKPILKSPTPHRFTHFLHISETLEEFSPVRLVEFTADISQQC